MAVFTGLVFLRTDKAFVARIYTDKNQLNHKAGVGTGLVCSAVYGTWAC